MSITTIKKRVAYFHDDKGVYVGKKAFSNTCNTFDYKGRTFNARHDLNTFLPINRWYWDVEAYQYNINNPDPMIPDKKFEPILDSEMYNVQMKTKVARDLNQPEKKGFDLNFKTILIILGIGILAYYILSGKIKLF